MTDKDRTGKCDNTHFSRVGCTAQQRSDKDEEMYELEMSMDTFSIASSDIK